MRSILFARLRRAVFCSFLSLALALAFMPAGAHHAWADESAAIDQVRAYIEQLPAPTVVKEADGPAIQQARAAYDSLSAAEQQLLDTETNREALHTTQSYGRVLELAEAGYAVLHEVDSSTSLANGVYTSSVSSSWDRGKSASKQDRDWTAAKVRVENGKAQVTLSVNSSTYSYVRASGIVCQRLSSSGHSESRFIFPVSLGKKMVFLAYSETMATEIAYSLTVNVTAGAAPNYALGSDEDQEQSSEQGGEGASDPAGFGVPLTQTDSETGAVVVERGTFEYSEDIAAYMFRLVAPSTLVSDGEHMWLRGAPKTAGSYSHVYCGLLEDTVGIGMTDGVNNGMFIPAETYVNGVGEEVEGFTIPLQSLERELDLCAYSVKNQHWVQVTRSDHSIVIDSSKLQWAPTEAEKSQVADVVELMEALPARNTIVPDNPEHEAAVMGAKDAFDALSRWQQAQIPARLKLLLDWDVSMFELGFNTEQLPMGMIGRAYDGAIYVSGKNGSAGKTISVVAGELPEGFTLEMDSAGLWAQFVGTPVANGSWTFTARIENGLGESVDKEFTIHVGYKPVILTKSLPAAVQGQAYEALLEADAYPDATWSIDAGNLPAGLMFVDGGAGDNTARIVGTPSKAGEFPLTFTCDNFANGMENVQLVLSVRGNSTAGQDAAQQQAAKDVVINIKTVNAKQVKKALKAANNPKAKTVTLGAKVKSIKKGSFAGTKITTLIVKTKKLTKKSVKGSLKGSKVKTLKVKVGSNKANKKQAKKYKKVFVKKNCGKKVRVTA